jgi:asparagine synthase (glutamine-hydrolysing)
LEQALSDAISDQSVADVPVGAFLSGGVDSSTVVALYQSVTRRPVKTYTIGFAEAGFDESVHAAAVARHLGTDHHEHHVTAREAREVIPLLPSIYDEPFADSSQIPTYLVSHFARRDVTVALTGDGGDELFAGYNRHVLAPRMWRAASAVPLPMRQIAGPLLGRLPSGLLGAASAMVGGSAVAHRGAKLRKAFIVGGRARSLQDVYRSYLDEWEGERSPVLGTIGEPESHGWLTDVPDVVAMTHCDAVGYLPDDILCKVDRASMAVSLETRVPFLDHRVAAVAARVPVGMKVSDHRGKMIVRKLLERHVPASLFDRPKAGFAVPVGKWICGDLREWAEHLLDPAAIKEQGWLDSGIIQRRWQDHLSGRRDSTPAIWAVLMFQAWLDQNRGG